MLATRDQGAEGMGRACVVAQAIIVGDKSALKRDGGGGLATLSKPYMLTVHCKMVTFTLCKFHLN